jgi:hypothetical protein
MNITLYHDRYTPVTPFVQMLKDVMAASNIEMYVEVLDLRAVYRTMFEQHVDNGRFDKWFDSVNALNLESQNDLVYKKANMVRPDTCTVLVVDGNTGHDFLGLQFSTSVSLATLQDEVTKLNPLETPQAIVQIVEHERVKTSSLPVVDLSNQKSVRKVVLEIISQLS